MNLKKIITLAAIILIVGGAADGILTNRAFATTLSNLIPNPSVEIAGTNPALPQGWVTGGFGSNKAVFTYPVAGFDGAGSKAVRVDVSNYVSGDAKWYFNEVPVVPGATYGFSDEYMSTAPSEVVVQFDLGHGNFSFLDLGTLAATSGVQANSPWQLMTATFTVPSGATALTVFHLLQSNGSLTTDDYSLSPVPTLNTGMVSIDLDGGFASGYTAAMPLLNAAHLPATYYIVTNDIGQTGFMSAANLTTLQTAGNEIGSESESHPFLATLTPAQMQTEIAGSRMALQKLGLSVSTFAYPFDSYNAAVEQQVANAGYTGARTGDLGFNTKTTNRSLLKIQSVTAATTVAQVESWINQARTSNTWLILDFQSIDTNGGQSTTPANFQQILSYLVQQNMKVVTNAQGITQFNLPK